jgi:hypothetical protein
MAALCTVMLDVALLVGQALGVTMTLCSKEPIGSYHLACPALFSMLAPVQALAGLIHSDAVHVVYDETAIGRQLYLQLESTLHLSHCLKEHAVSRSQLLPGGRG